MEYHYKDHIDRCFANAENYKSKLTTEVLTLEGLTGAKNRHFFNNLLELADARYLEIGAWKGASTCAALYGNNASMVCIENWSEFGGIENRETLMANIAKYKGQSEVAVIEQDCFAAGVPASLPHKFNIYTYDGEHSHDSQYKALTHYYDILDDLFIYVVDDWDMESVRSGTSAAIRDLRLKTLYGLEVRLSAENYITENRDTWWNGIYVALLKKTDAADVSKNPPSTT